jgi:transposase
VCCSCSITELKNNVSDSTKRSILAVWAEGVIRPDDGLVSETFQVAVNGSTKRIHWTTEENRRILEATLVPGASIARIARENGVNVNQVFQGRYEYRNGTGWAAKHPRAKLLPVTVVAEPSGAVVPEVASAAAPEPPSASIHIELPGRALASVEAGADPGLARCAGEPSTLIDLKAAERKGRVL